MEVTTPETIVQHFKLVPHVTLTSVLEDLLTSSQRVCVCATSPTAFTVRLVTHPPLLEARLCCCLRGRLGAETQESTKKAKYEGSDQHTRTRWRDAKAGKAVSDVSGVLSKPTSA